MHSLDVAVIAAYCVAVVVFGLVLAGRQRDASDYFLGHRGLPWWALMMSIVATETSALTVMSIPGFAARGNLTFLQIAFGYLVGRIGVAALLLPGYFEGTQETAYQRLERRFGTAARRTASGVFLLVGTSLWLAGADDGRMRQDWIYPTFVITQLPTGLAGLVVAGILAAAMSSHASAVNSLASASTLDFYAPLTRRQDPGHLLRVGRWLTLFWTAVLVTGAMAFRDQNTPVVQLALSIVSITYGGLLGTYMLGGLWPRARQRDVIAAIVVSAAVMTPVVLGVPWRLFPGLAWWWYVALGTAVTVAVGLLSSVVGRSDGRTVGPEGGVR